MKVSRTIAYAVYATLELASYGDNRPIPCSEVANRGKVSDRFLLQILRILVKKGILESKRGIDGGYLLGRSPAQITLLDIVEAFENPLRPSLPDLGSIPGPVRKQLLMTLQRVSSAARQELHKLTFEDLRQAGAGI
jgi:Rrf2 family protein